MTLDEITRLVPPPAEPLFARRPSRMPKEPIGLVERELGSFFRTYGSGKFDANESLVLYNIYDPEYWPNIDDHLENYLDLQKDTPQFFPHDCYPVPGGLIPVASGSCHLAIYLLPSDDAGTYSVVLDDQGEFPEFKNISILQFLWKLFNKQIDGLENYFMGNLCFEKQALFPIKHYDVKSWVIPWGDDVDPNH